MASAERGRLSVSMFSFAYRTSKRKRVWLLLLALISSGLVSFYFGMSSVPNSESTDVRTSLQRSILDERNRGTVADFTVLMKEPLTRQSLLAMHLAIVEMDAANLVRLWDGRFKSFDYGDGAKREIAKAILGRLASLDPQAALKRVNDAGSHRYDMIAVALAGWATKDQPAALAWCRDQTDVRARHRGLTAIIEQVGREKPEAAVDLYLKVVDEKLMRQHQWNASKFFQRWAKEDPLKAVSAAQRIHRATSNEWPMKSTVEAWARFDGKTASQWVSNIKSEGLRNRSYIRLFSGWAETDPPAAAEFALGLRESDVFDEGMVHVLNGWSHNDFHAAAAWVDAVDDPALHARLQRMLVGQSQGFANREPALEYALDQLDHNPEMMKAITVHAHELATRDPEKAFAWARENLTDPEHLKQFDDAILKQLAQHLPDEAAPYLAELSTDHPLHTSLHSQTAEGWARKDREAALAWLKSLPTGAAQEAALLGYADGWMTDTTQHEAASRWIREFPKGDVRDRLVDRQARALMNVKNIQPAIDAAAEIEDPFLRDKTFEGILKTWYRDEIKAEAAREFIENTDLITDTVRWRILNRKDGHP